MTFPVQGSLPPNFSYIAAFPFQTGLAPQLVIEDSANNFLYVFANNGTTGSNGTLPGFSLLHTYAIPPNDGAGPIYTGDLNHDGNVDFILNGQTGLSASVYFGDGNGGFLVPTPQNRYTFDHNVHSLLMQDMNGDGIADMVVEGDGGIIEIFEGNANGTFTTSLGGTPAGVNALAGQGGHLAAINPITHDILTTTPAGLSLLQGAGSLTYLLKGIYNIGPGRSTYALANFFGSANLDFAVDSPEGVAIVRADASGGFLTSHAYSTLAPALGAVVGKFRTIGNPNGNLDVVAGTGAIQAQLLTGNGDGTFGLYPGVVNSVPLPPNIPTSAWSTVLPGDFDGDGKLDLLYTMTGGGNLQNVNPVLLYAQYGNGDGTFNQSAFTFDDPGGSGSPAWQAYFETATGDFNGDNTFDLAYAAASLYGTHNGCPGGRVIYCLGSTNPNPANARFQPGSDRVLQGQPDEQAGHCLPAGLNFVPYLNSGDGVHFTQEPAITGASCTATIPPRSCSPMSTAMVMATWSSSTTTPRPTPSAQARSRRTRSTSGMARVTEPLPQRRRSSLLVATTTLAR